MEETKKIVKVSQYLEKEPPNLFKMNKEATMPVSVFNEMIHNKDVVKVKQERTPKQKMLDVLQSVSEEQLTEDHFNYLRGYLLNQALIKEMMVDARSYIRSKIDNNPERYYGNGEFGQFVKTSLGAGSASKYIYFTINLKPEAQNDFSAIARTVEKTTSKVWIKRYLLSYEQRGSIGSDTFGTGVHVNLLIEKTETHMNKKPAECLKEMKNTWKNMCDVTVPAVLTMRYAPDPANFVNYVKGIKDGEEKQPLVEADKVWRQMLGIPDSMGTWENF